VDVIRPAGVLFVVKMAEPIPQYSRPEVNRAGKTLVNPDASASDLEEALTIMNNWRVAHNTPLNNFRLTLRRKAKKIYPPCLVAQRIKRLASIEDKLKRFPQMKLTQMQDIGGCRAVVENPQQVKALASTYYDPRGQHELVRVKDYIESPRDSGYRGMHFIYRYSSTTNPAHNGLQIEIQLRSVLQHNWATAVEVVGTFLRQALKTSQGEDPWLRFFALMGTFIALKENTPSVPGTPTERGDLKKEILHYYQELDMAKKLQAYSSVIEKTHTDPQAKYFILLLIPGNRSTWIFPYKSKELAQASKDYLRVERFVRGKRGAEAVLVSVDSVNTLRRAYPNYFFDIKLFFTAVLKAIAED